LTANVNPPNPRFPQIRCPACRRVRLGGRAGPGDRGGRPGAGRTKRSGSRCVFDLGEGGQVARTDFRDRGGRSDRQVAPTNDAWAANRVSESVNLRSSVLIRGSMVFFTRAAALRARRLCERMVFPWLARATCRSPLPAGEAGVPQSSPRNSRATGEDLSTRLCATEGLTSCPDR
jgi:hypothetical protein